MSGHASDSAERAILGALLLAPRLHSTCADLSTDDFRSPLRASIYSEILDALQDGEPVDCILIEARLEARRISAPRNVRYWFTALSTLVDDALRAGAVDEERLPHYVLIVRKAADRRRLCAMGAA